MKEILSIVAGVVGEMALAAGRGSAGREMIADWATRLESAAGMLREVAR